MLQLDNEVLGGADRPDGGGGERTDGQRGPRRSDGGETQRGPEASGYRAQLLEFVGGDPGQFRQPLSSLPGLVGCLLTGLCRVQCRPLRRLLGVHLGLRLSLDGPGDLGGTAPRETLDLTDRLLGFFAGQLGKVGELVLQDGEVRAYADDCVRHR